MQTREQMLAQLRENIRIMQSIRRDYHTAKQAAMVSTRIANKLGVDDTKELLLDSFIGADYACNKVHKSIENAMNFLRLAEFKIKQEARDDE